MATRTQQFDSFTIRKIAVEADRDPRSVVEVLEGRGRPTTRESVRKAMVRLGLNVEAADARAARGEPR